MTPNPAYIAAIQQAVAGQPFSRMLGAFRLAELEFDRAVVDLELDARHMQMFGIPHGGVLATLVDSAAFWAPFLRLPADAGLVSVDLKLNYLKSPTHGLLRAEGRSLRTGRQLCYADASVRDASGELLAHGTSTLMVLPGKGMDLGVPKFLPA